MWERAGGLDASLDMCFDYDLWWRMAALGPIGYVDRPVAATRDHGETKTRQAPRTLELPARAAEALRVRTSQLHVQLAAADRWHGADLVFCTSVGTALDAGNVRRSFRRVAAAAGLDAQAWTPRELRHSFVSLL